MVIAISILIFCSMLALLLGLYAAVRGRRATIENRLQRVVIGPIQREEQVEAVFVSNADRKRRKKREAKGFQRYVIRLEDKLLKAGLMLRAQEFVMFAGGLTLLAAIMVFLLSGAMINVILALVAGMIVPLVFVNMRIEKRKR